MSIFAYLYHFLFNSKISILQTSHKEFINVELVPISIGSSMKPKNTRLFYSQNGLIDFSGTPIIVFIDYDDPNKLIPQLILISLVSKVDSFVILSDYEFSDIYSQQYLYHQMLPRINIFLGDCDFTKRWRKFYKDEHIVGRIVVREKIENFIFILFYLILTLCLGMFYAILRIWIGLRANSDPVCTSSELASCPIVLFNEITTKDWENCMICMETFHDSNQVRVLSCLHYFHTVCIDPWLRKRSARCPYCRQMMKIEI